jgi:nicotinamidase/pyrazinamidase
MAARIQKHRQRRVYLLVIDPQNSFCRVVEAARQQVEHDGELSVPGAWDDMLRVAQVVKGLGKKLNAIFVTLDSHQRLHIAHGVWYEDSHGNRPQPFTYMREDHGRIINYSSDDDGTTHDIEEFTTFCPSVLSLTLDYLKALATSKRYPHRIWPEHCLIGTPGHNVVAPLMAAMLEWSRLAFSTLQFITKGSNPFVEHFSAVMAEVPDPNDPTTQINSQFIQTIMEADEILLCGEGGSYALASTVTDMANVFLDDSFACKCVLLTDGTSPGHAFEAHQNRFISIMQARGMRTTTTAGYLA